MPIKRGRSALCICCLGSSRGAFKLKNGVSGLSQQFRGSLGGGSLGGEAVKYEYRMASKVSCHEWFVHI